MGKQIGALNALDSINPEDLVPVYDLSEVGEEKAKKVRAIEFMIPRYPSDGKLQAVALAGITVCLRDYSGTPKAVVTVLDCLRSVHAANGVTLTYGIAKEAETPIWSDNVDPSQAYLEFLSLELGNQMIWIRVNDGTSTVTVVTYVTVQDNDIIAI